MLTCVMTMMMGEMAVVYRGLATSVNNRCNVRRRKTLPVAWLDEKPPGTIMS